MAVYKRIALAVFFAALAVETPSASAFQPASGASTIIPRSTSTSSSTTSTQLEALPPMIISGAIKKYRENQAQKRMPMATKDEAKLEAPGLRVGSAVWKWPPVWPYDRQFFTPPEDLPQKKTNVNEMASMLSGIQQMPGAAAVSPTEEEENANKLVPTEYWGKEKAEVRTDMDPDAIQKLKE